MHRSLAEALEHVELQPGQTYRETVNGRTVEVRVLETVPTSELADQVMLEPWFVIPDPPTVRMIRAIPGPVDPPDPPVVPEDEETV